MTKSTAVELLCILSLSLITTANGAAMQATPWIDVTDQKYGATGQGTTDDLPAINQALRDCPSGGTVFFPAGTYAVTNTVVVNKPCHLVGQGAGITEGSDTMTGSNLKAISIFSPNALPIKFPAGAPVISFHDVTHASLDGLSIDCSSIPAAIGLQYDSDNNPPSSFNSFRHFTVKKCHMAFVNGLISSSPADCNANPNQSGCYQADTFELDDYIFLGNCADTTGEAIHVNSANAGQGSVIGRGNIQCYSVGHHIVSTNGLLWIQHNNGGSPPRPPIAQAISTYFSAFFVIEPSVAGSVNLLDLEVEGAWTYAGLDHGCNAGTNSVSSWIGNAWNSHLIVVDGCDNVFSASNQSNNSTVTNKEAHITSINEVGWQTSPPATPGSLSKITLGTATFGDTIVSQNVVSAKGSGCPVGFPSTMLPGDLQTCEGQHAGQLFIGSDLALLGNGDGIIDTGSPWRFNKPAQFSQPAQFTEVTPPLTGGSTAQDTCQGNAATHTLQCSYNGATFFSQTQTIGSGTIALGTNTILSSSCALVSSPNPVPGVLSTDAITWSFSTDPNSVPGYGAGSTGSLSIWAFPTANNVNFRVCNLTSAAIIPGAVTLNWIVTR